MRLHIEICNIQQLKESNSFCKFYLLHVTKETGAFCPVDVALETSRAVLVIFRRAPAADVIH